MPKKPKKEVKKKKKPVFRMPDKFVLTRIPAPEEGCYSVYEYEIKNNFDLPMGSPWDAHDIAHWEEYSSEPDYEPDPEEHFYKVTKFYDDDDQ